MVCKPAPVIIYPIKYLIPGILCLDPILGMATCTIHTPQWLTCWVH